MKRWKNTTVNGVDERSALAAADQWCPYCEMLPFYQACDVAVEVGRWLTPTCSTGFSVSRENVH